MKILISFLASCCFLLLISLSAQVKINGIITNGDTKEPLANTHILLLEDASIGTITDSLGRYTLTLKDDHQTGNLLIQHIGYAELIEAYDINISTSYEINLWAISAEIREVVIVASKSIGEEFVVQEISKLEIYANPNSRADPIRAVQSLPYSTTTDETANLSLRGSPAGETSFILNNVPVEDAFKLDQSNGVGQFSIFNTSIIKKVDVHPSNPPLEYGSTSSGLVALHTDDFNENNSQSLNLTLAGAGISINRRISPKSTLVVYGNVGFHGGLKWFNPSAFDAINSFNSLDAGLYWTTSFNEKTKLKIFNYTLRENYDYALDLPSFDGSAFQNKKRNLSIINFEKRLSDNSSLDINQGISFTDANYNAGNADHNVQKSDWYTSINYTHFSDRNSFKVGIAYSAHLFDNYGTYPTYFWANDIFHPATSYGNQSTIHHPEVYVYNKLRISEQLSIGLGGRTNFLQSSDINTFGSYQFNLNYKLNEKNCIIFSLGRYHKLFLPGEQFFETTSAISDHYSLDYSYDNNGFSARAAMYKKKTTYPSNNLDVFGGELFVSYSQGKINTSLSAAHIQSDYVVEEASYPSDHDIGYFIRHLMKYQVTPVLELSSSLLHRSGKYAIPVLSSSYHVPTQTYAPTYAPLDNGERLPTYTLWDMSLAYIIELGNGSMVSFLSCNNVLNLKNVAGPKYDEQYHQVGDQYFGSRVVFLGFVYNWN